jgi:hypothetical protein
MRMTWSALPACVIAMALEAMVPGPTGLHTWVNFRARRGGCSRGE